MPTLNKSDYKSICNITHVQVAEIWSFNPIINIKENAGELFFLETVSLTFINPPQGTEEIEEKKEQKRKETKIEFATIT